MNVTRHPASGRGIGGPWGLMKELKHAEHSTGSAAERILARLDKVRRCERGRYGHSWMACCPAHEDKSPSLRVTEADDGRVLIFCNAGCSASNVLASIGLGLSDLYPERLADHLPPKQRKQFLDARQILKTLKFEVLLVALAAEDLHKGVKVNDADRERLWEAVLRIRNAVESV